MLSGSNSTHSPALARPMVFSKPGMLLPRIGSPKNEYSNILLGAQNALFNESGL